MFTATRLGGGPSRRDCNPAVLALSHTPPTQTFLELHQTQREGLWGSSLWPIAGLDRAILIQPPLTCKASLCPFSPSPWQLKPYLLGKPGQVWLGWLTAKKLRLGVVGRVADITQQQEMNRTLGCPGTRYPVPFPGCICPCQNPVPPGPGPCSESSRQQFLHETSEPAVPAPARGRLSLTSPRRP